MKKQKIYAEFEKYFENRLSSKKFDYFPTLQDMYVIFNIFNKYIFKDTLNEDEVEIMITDFGVKSKDKGNTSFGKNQKPTAKILIKIMRHIAGDNFFQIVNVLAHEMIHAYDMMHGDIYQLLVKHSDELLSGFYVTHDLSNNQYVGKEKISAHGKIFKQFQEKFAKYGFEISQFYDMRKSSVKIRKFKEDEKFDFFNETVDSQEALTYRTVKRIFDALDAPGKRLVYKNAKQWFIEFP